MNLEDYRDPKLLVVDGRDACRSCGSTTMSAALRRIDGSIAVWCIDSRCRAYESSRNVQKDRYIAKWDGVPKGPKAAERDHRFMVPFDRQEYIYARDACCVYCSEPLTEEVSSTALLDEWRQVYQPRSNSAALELPLSVASPIPKSDSSLSQLAAMKNRPIRVKRKRQTDHLVPYWAGIQMAHILDARGVDLIGMIAVVGSCPDCNSKRQLRPSRGQLFNTAVAAAELVRLQRLFVDRILIDTDVDPIADTRRFCDALEHLRTLMTVGTLDEVSVAEKR